VSMRTIEAQPNRPHPAIPGGTATQESMTSRNEPGPRPARTELVLDFAEQAAPVGQAE